MISRLHKSGGNLGSECLRILHHDDSLVIVNGNTTTLSVFVVPICVMDQVELGPCRNFHTKISGVSRMAVIEASEIFEDSMLAVQFGKNLFTCDLKTGNFSEILFANISQSILDVITDSSKSVPNRIWKWTIATQTPNQRLTLLLVPVDLETPISLSIQPLPIVASLHENRIVDARYIYQIHTEFPLIELLYEGENPNYCIIFEPSGESEKEPLHSQANPEILWQIILGGKIRTTISNFSFLSSSVKIDPKILEKFDWKRLVERMLDNPENHYVSVDPPESLGTLRGLQLNPLVDEFCEKLYGCCQIPEIYSWLILRKWLLGLEVDDIKPIHKSCLSRLWDYTVTEMSTPNLIMDLAIMEAWSLCLLIVWNGGKTAANRKAIEVRLVIL